MSFLGKVLIVAQVVLSVLFMCAAGAVFSMHTEWKKEAETLSSQIATNQQTHSDEIANLNQQVTNLTQEAQAQKYRSDAQVGRNQDLERQIAAANDETNRLNQQLNRQLGLAQTKSNEAEFRQEEAEKLRVEYEELTDTLDAQIQITTALEDTLANERQVHADLVAQYEEAQAQLEFLEKLARANNFDTDRRAVAALSEPPPPVEAVVRDVRKDQANRTKFVHITAGTDDGLRNGHVLDIYRTAERNNGRAKYLGKIRLMLVEPDEAVGLVIDDARSGIIEVGDNATTKL